MRPCTLHRLALSAILVSSVAARAQDDSAPSVPTDLRPLLAQPVEFADVVLRRYQRDHRQLDHFYRLPLAPRHTERMTQFGRAWLAALTLPANARLLAEDQNRSDANVVAAVRADLDAIAATAAEAAPLRVLVPFAPHIHAVVEARRRVEPFEAEAVGARMDALAREVADAQAQLQRGAFDRRHQAAASAAVTDLADALKEWFGFYDGYDPLFSWWVTAPYAAADAALRGYAAALAASAAGPAATDAQAIEATATEATATDATNAPSDAAPESSTPDLGQVPDLAALATLSGNELRDIVREFGGHGYRSQVRSRRGPGRRRGATRDAAFYQAWRTALDTLDFAALSRPAQVSWLSLRHEIETAQRRLSTPAQTDIPHVRDDSGIEGKPIGETAVELALAEQLIPYTPAEVIAIGDREYAWCLAEAKRAAAELGFGDDWRAALEHVKTMHVGPGSQPTMIRGLLTEAMDFLEQHDLVTVPAIARETLRMTMMSPERQLVNPFFLGGEQIIVSFPTDTMAHDAKRQSMRGNNIPFSRATAHHELIPGHNLQRFVNRRFSPLQAGGLDTPFYVEGWAVYWEMLLYSRDFPAHAAEHSGGPPAAANRLGFLFWRMHRCARITFSLRFHMGLWSAQQCIDFLVEGVGHERDNATAEVRRSFGGAYSPLYQAAYLLGATQLRALRAELVDTGEMPEKAFHDAILRAGTMQIALIRLLLQSAELSPDTDLDWHFYGDPGEAPEPHWIRHR